MVYPSLRSLACYDNHKQQLQHRHHHRIQFLVLCFLNDFVALLKRQGVNVKGLLKSDAVKEEPQPYIDCTGNLQVLYQYLSLHKVVNRDLEDERAEILIANYTNCFFSKTVFGQFFLDVLLTLKL